MVNQYKVLDIIGHVSEMFRRESLVMSSKHNHVVMWLYCDPIGHYLFQGSYGIVRKATNDDEVFVSYPVGGTLVLLIL